MDEKKVYSVVGTVTIGTDEYRDLVEASITQEKLADDYRSKYWAEQSKVSKLEKQVEALKAKIAKCEKYISSKNTSDDAVTLIMSLFGED